MKNQRVEIEIPEEIVASYDSLCKKRGISMEEGILLSMNREMRGDITVKPEAEVSGRQVINTNEACRLLGYKDPRSVRRKVKEGRLKRLDFPAKPFHFFAEDVLALSRGNAPASDN